MIRRYIGYIFVFIVSFGLVGGWALMDFCEDRSRKKSVQLMKKDDSSVSDNDYYNLLCEYYSKDERAFQGECSFKTNEIGKYIIEVNAKGFEESPIASAPHLGIHAINKSINIHTRLLKMFRQRLNKVSLIRINLSDSDSYGNQYFFFSEILPNEAMANAEVHKPNEVIKLVSLNIKIVKDTVSGKRWEYRTKRGH